MKQAAERGLSLNRTQIKYIAILAMTGNHLAAALLQKETWAYILLTDIGYLTAPVMCFFLVEGCHYTHDRRAYGLRLLFFALLSQLPYRYALGVKNLNVMVTLFLCLLMVCVLEYEKNPLRRACFVTGLIILSFFCDWAGFLPAAAVLFERSRGNREEQKAAWRFFLFIFFVSMLIGNAEIYGLTARTVLLSAGEAAGPLLAAILVLYLYNGEKSDKKAASGWISRFERWFFYLYYPAHLAVLWVIRVYCFSTGR